MLNPHYPYDTSSSEWHTPFEQLKTEPPPRTPEELWHLETRLQNAAKQASDQILAAQLQRVHEDKSFVREAIESARQQASAQGTWVHKGSKEVSILLSGGHRMTIKTPYLYLKEPLRRGRKRKRRRKNGCGMYPVLEALGIYEGVTPATRSEIALHTVQAASYQEAAAMLERRGMSCDISTLRRIATLTGKRHMALRDQALACSEPIPSDGPLAGKRVRISLDGGRVRTRKKHGGRKTKKGRHGFSTPWREPRVLVIDILDEEGKTDKLSMPLYDAVIADADSIFAIVIGYLRLLGVAHAKEVEFIADGAEWIWDRMERLKQEAQIDKLTEVVDFYHASEHLSKTVELCKNMTKAERTQLYQELRHILRHEYEGVTQVLSRLQELARGRRAKAMRKKLEYFEENAKRMAYLEIANRKLAIGSGQVESAVRRVINLRFKSSGSFWKEDRVNALMHLRAYFKAGRWEELMQNVLNQTFGVRKFNGDEKAQIIPFIPTDKPASKPHHIFRREVA